MLRSLGLISIVVAWASIVALVTGLRLGSEHSISRHAASNKIAYFLMAFTETLLLSLFTVFTIFWFGPHFKAPTLLTVVIVGSALGLVIAAWVPDIKGVRRIIHEYTSYGAFLLMIPATTLIITLPKLGSFARFMATLTLFYMISTVLLFSLSPKVKRFHLYFQMVYLLSFHLVILSAVYIMR